MIHALVDPIIEGAEERTTPMGLGLRLLVEDISIVFAVRQDTSIHRPHPYQFGIESLIPIPRIWPCTSWPLIPSSFLTADVQRAVCMQMLMIGRVAFVGSTERRSILASSSHVRGWIGTSSRCDDDDESAKRPHLVPVPTITPSGHPPTNNLYPRNSSFSS